MCHYEKQLKETQAQHEKAQEDLQRKYSEERQGMEKEVEGLQAQASELQGELMRVRQEAESRWTIEKSSLQICLEEKASLLEHLKVQHEQELQTRLEEAQEGFSRERKEWLQTKVQLEVEMRTWAQTLQEEKAELEDGLHRQMQELVEKHALENEQLLRDLAEEHQLELQECR